VLDGESDGDEAGASVTVSVGRRSTSPSPQEHKSPTTTMIKDFMLTPSTESLINEGGMGVGRRTAARGSPSRRPFVPIRSGQLIRIFIPSPASSSTRILVPVAGSLTPWVGISSNQYFLVSLNVGFASCPRM